MCQMSMLKEMIKEGAAEGGEADLGGLFGSGDMELDTLIAFKDSPMANNEDVPEVLQGATMAMQVSESKNIFQTVLQFDFDNVGQIADFYDALSEVSDEGGGPGMGGMMPSLGMFETKKKTLIRKPIDMSSLAEQLGGEESMAMMKMMMAGATYKTVYHLPKKVKRTDIKDAQVDGKTVTVTRNYLDIIEGKTNLDGMIKY